LLTSRTVASRIEIAVARHDDGGPIFLGSVHLRSSMLLPSAMTDVDVVTDEWDQRCQPDSDSRGQSIHRWPCRRNAPTTQTQPELHIELKLNLT